jgi:hypothetical protein
MMFIPEFPTKVVTNCFSTRTQYVFRAKKSLWKMKYHVESNLAIYGIVSAIIAAGALYSFMKKTPELEELLAKPIYASDVDPSSISFVNYRTEMNFPKDKVREWGKVEAEIKIASLGARGVNGVDLATMVKKQCFKVHIIGKDSAGVEGIRPVQVFALAPDCLCLCKHYVSPFDRSHPLFMRYEDIDYPLSWGKMRFNDMNEIVTVNHNIPFFARGLQKFLLNEQYLGRLEILNPLESDEWIPAVPRDALLEGKPYKSIIFPFRSFDGQCGQPILGRIGDECFLLGLVSYGWQSSTCVGATFMTRDWLDDIEKSNIFPFVEDVHLTAVETIPLSLHSDSRDHEKSSHLVPIGTMSQKTNKFSTGLRKTVFHDAIIASGVLKKPYSVPSAVRVIKDGEMYTPFKHTFSGIDSACDITLEEEDEAVKHFVTFLSTLAKEKGIKLSPLSFEEAIFGNESLGIDRINFKSSCGAELRKFGIHDKYDLFDRAMDDEPYMFSEEAKNIIMQIIELMDRNILYCPNVDGTLKDEVRPSDKVDVANLRIFYVLCFCVNIYARMMCMPILAFALRNPSVSECYGGMNAGSSEWNDLAQRLRTHPLFFDMDFSKFDIRHGRSAFRMFAKTMFLLAMACGYSKENCNRVYILCFSMAFQMFRYNSDVYLKMRGLPSGWFLTLLMNSFVNSLLLRIAWLRVFKTLQDFHDRIKTGNVGDDNVNGVAMCVKDQFNMITLQPIYLKMGYLMTPASKSNVVQKFLPFADLSFLKRKFVADERFGYVAPIDTDSIYKALMFEDRKCGVSHEQRLLDVALSAQREFFLHGRKKFDGFQGFITHLFKIKGREIELLKYDQLVEEYENKVFRTFMC